MGHLPEIPVVDNPEVPPCRNCAMLGIWPEGCPKRSVSLNDSFCPRKNISTSLGSLASRYQSGRYGGQVKSDSSFSRYQSVGAKGYNSNGESDTEGIVRFALLLAALLTWAGYMPDSL
jgi:hypothetical protein